MGMLTVYENIEFSAALRLPLSTTPVQRRAKVDEIISDLGLSACANTRVRFVDCLSTVWARGHCRISPPRFLAECCKRQLNQGSFVLLYFRLFTFSDLY